MVEFYVNGQFVHFLVCGRPNLALTRRYSRIFTGAIYGYRQTGLITVNSMRKWMRSEMHCLKIYLLWNEHANIHDGGA